MTEKRHTSAVSAENPKLLPRLQASRALARNEMADESPRDRAKKEAELRVEYMGRLKEQNRQKGVGGTRVSPHSSSGVAGDCGSSASENAIGAVRQNLSEALEKAQGHPPQPDAVVSQDAERIEYEARSRRYLEAVAFNESAPIVGPQREARKRPSRSATTAETAKRTIKAARRILKRPRLSDEKKVVQLRRVLRTNPQPRRILTEEALRNALALVGEKGATLKDLEHSLGFAERTIRKHLVPLKAAGEVEAFRDPVERAFVRYRLSQGTAR